MFSPTGQQKASQVATIINLGITTFAPHYGRELSSLLPIPREILRPANAFRRYKLSSPECLMLPTLYTYLILIEWPPLGLLANSISN